MKLKFILNSIVALVVGLAGISSLSHALVSATLPASRSVETGQTATVFATLINTESETVHGCVISLATGIDATFSFQATDPATNAVVGAPNTPVSIAAGASQSFVLSITPNADLNPTQIAFEFRCDGNLTALSVIGLNTLLLSASATPVADVVAIALTPSGDGIADLPKDQALGFLSLATVNVGASDVLTVSARGPVGFEGDLFVCETNPGDGTCKAAPATQIMVSINSNDTPTFAIFLSSALALPLDPAGRRVFVDFKDSSEAIRGSTSVAVAGGGPDITPLFPRNEEQLIQLPDEAGAADQLAWIMQQWQTSDTTLADINARFTQAALNSVNAQGWRDFFNTLRNSFPNATLKEVVSLTPIAATAVIVDENDNEGWLTLSTELATPGSIKSFGVSPFGGTVQYFNDQTLTAAQAADDFTALAARTSLYIARVDRFNQCTPLLTRNPDELMPTASIFKMYVLSAVAAAVADGAVNLNDSLPVDANFYALGAALNSEPAGTPSTVVDMARMMMGNSDNTATDLLHNLAGRTRLDAAVTNLNHSDPDALIPLLSISQNFALLFALSQTDAQAYLDASEAEQQLLVVNVIDPLTPVLGGSFTESLIVPGTWQASAADICRALAGLRAVPAGSDAFELVDQAMGAQAAIPDLRDAWDRVWYKGGSLATVNELRVLTNAWLVESASRGKYVVVGFTNNPISGNVDQFQVNSLLSRLLQLLAEDGL